MILMDWLRRQKEQRGVLAQLRCGLVKSKEQRAWPLLARFDGIEGYKGQVVRTIAALYASHPEETNTANKSNMGTLCLRLCGDGETPWQDEKPGPMAMRLQYLLAAETEEICQRVARLVLRCKSSGIPVNYEQLYTDLLHWEKPSARERVRQSWAQHFWAPVMEKSLPSDNADALDEFGLPRDAGLSPDEEDES